MIKQLLIVGAGCMFFVSPAVAQTEVITIKTCREVATNNDPSIVVVTTIQSHQECGKGEPVKIKVVDRHFGIDTMTKTPFNVPRPARPIEPWKRDIYATHKPCRKTLKNEDGTYEGVLLEWHVPIGTECGGRPPGSFYRVYTATNEVCIRPNGGCIAASNLKPDGQRRFKEMLEYAFAEVIAMH